jgi:hypothetical protein
MTQLEQTTFAKMFGDEEEKKDCVACFLASSQSGKTTLLFNMITEISNAYDIIILFTTNSMSDIYKNFTNTCKHLLMVQDFDDRIIHMLHFVNQQCNNEYRILIIMDDIIDVRSTKVVAQLFSTYRNAHFSTIHSIQYKTYMNKNSRAQCHRFLLGHLNNLDEIRKICADLLFGFKDLQYPPDIKKKSEKLDYLVEWYIKNTSNYGFIVLDNLNNKLYSIKSKLVI